MRVLIISGSRARLPDSVYPLGPAIVGTVARRAGCEVGWFDALRHANPAQALKQTIAAFTPDVCFFSIRNIDSGAFPSPELHYEDHTALVESCRCSSDAPIILGGSGFSLMPEAFMKLLVPNAGVVGEGEAVIAELLQTIAAGNLPQGIITAPRTTTGGIILADRDLFDANWYYTHGGVANIQTKRGCGFSCIYCTYPKLEGHGLRSRPPEVVVEEIASLVKMGIRHFFFVDAVFNRPESHAAGICEEIIRQGLNISFSAYFAPTGDLTEFPNLLKRAGCEAVEFGTDSLSDPVLEALQKGFTASEAMAYAQRLATVDIPQCHNLILGGPGETLETMDESVARLDTLTPRAVIATIGLRVFPGTRLAELTAERGGNPSMDLESLAPMFYIEDAVAESVVEKTAVWVDARPGWICPGLKKRYNLRYLVRQRERRGRKGVLWTLF
ncbi:MAG: radical SAM protein [Myxococcota bacterium]|nr:radical SAM protein [Myxococcota bacterium]